MTDPVEIVPFGRAAVQSFRWAHAGQDRITLVARARYAVQDDETLRRLDPEPLRGGDLAPFRDRADVLVFGDPDRHGERVPLWLEGETSLLDTTAPVLADRGAPAVVPEALAVPEDFDWAAHQEAPPTQQTTLLRGGERFVAGPLAGRIPRTRGVVYVADAGAPKEQGDAIDMDLDAVHVDLDHRVCSLVYRSVFLLDAADELDGRALHVGIEPENEADDETAGVLAEPAAGDALTTLARRTATYDPRGAAPASWASSDGGGAAPATWTSDDLGRAQQAQHSGSSGASQYMAATASFTASTPAERGFPTDVGGASALASEDQAGVRVNRSKPASAAPTPPGTAAVRRALYERFRP